MTSKLRLRLQIWSLQLLSRIVRAPLFPVIVLRPLLRIGFYWTACAILFDRPPKWLTANPEAAEMLSDLRMRWNAPVKIASPETNRAFGQTITWGLAGAGVVMLTTIVTAHLPGLAIWIATACFSLSVPVLIVLGIVYQSQIDPPATVRSAFGLHLLICVAHAIFYIGFGAFLWSYDPKISMIFVVGCFLAWRYLERYSIKHLKSSQG